MVDNVKWQDAERARLQKSEDHLVDEANLETTKPLGVVVGGIYTSAATTFNAGSFVPFTFDATGNLRTNAQLNASSVAISVDLTAASDSVAIQGYNGATPTKVSVNTSGYVEVSIKEGGSAIQQYTAESTIPNEVSDASTISAWADTFGRPVIKGYGFGNDALNVAEVAPALLLTQEAVDLNAVTTTGAGSAYDVSQFNKITYHIVTTSVSTGGTVRLESSLDGTNYYTTVAEVMYTTSKTHEVNINDVKYKYLRANVSARTDGTVTVRHIAGN